MSYIIRPLNEEDLNQYVLLLRQLTVTGNLSHETKLERYFKIVSNPDHFIFVLDDTNGKIFGCATLVIEPKFIYDASNLGHIEDVCIDKTYRGKDYGKILMDYCSQVAESLNCYKLSLTCSAKNIIFYEKCGFHKGETQMVKRFVRSKL